MVQPRERWLTDRQTDTHTRPNLYPWPLTPEGKRSEGGNSRLLLCFYPPWDLSGQFAWDFPCINTIECISRWGSAQRDKGVHLLQPNMPSSTKLLSIPHMEIPNQTRVFTNGSFDKIFSLKGQSGGKLWGQWPKFEIITWYWLILKRTV